MSLIWMKVYVLRTLSLTAISLDLSYKYRIWVIEWPSPTASALLQRQKVAKTLAGMSIFNLLGRLDSSHELLYRLKWRVHNKFFVTEYLISSIRIKLK